MTSEGRRVLFTGGGSAGHATPNLALIERFQREGWLIDYVGSVDGIEQEVIAPTGVVYHAVASGKLRRYFSWQNFIDPFRILLGVLQSVLLCRRLAPDVLFSKGGFIAVPVVIGAWLNRIPVVIHESDVTPGLANRICIPLAKYVCVTFPQTERLLAGREVVVTGTPVREAILQGDAARGRALFGLAEERPTLLVFGGSLGAEAINRCVYEALDRLLVDYQVVHICGAGNLRPDLDGRAGYHQREYLHGEFGDLLAAADLVVSRAGANSLYELLVCRKPHLLIPLGLEASRGDQIENARTFSELGMSEVIFEQELNPDRLLERVAATLAERELRTGRMATFAVPESVEIIFRLLADLAGG